tara:strand:+ start:754 stop:1437 length:684 start_codon:yes stop_codon:yes gene_type:complete
MKDNFLFKPKNYSAKILDHKNIIPIGKIFCVGRNYPKHAEEMNETVEKDEPFFFSKPPQSLTQETIISYPNNPNNLHHEVELVVIIGLEGKEIQAEESYKHILGYAVGIDLTKRDLQKIAKVNSKPWDLSKGFDNSAPISLVKLNQNNLIKEGKIELRLNGRIKQSGNISEMIWPIDQLISHLSNFITLYPGDIIFTGTPAGVGKVCKNDKIEASIEGVGKLEVIFN